MWGYNGIDYRRVLSKPDSHGVSVLQDLVGICDCIKVLGLLYGIDYRPVLGEPGLDG